MPPIDFAKIEDLKRTWTDRFVRANPDHPELKRFEGKVGRVVTVNWSGKALVDFADGAWYDIPADDAHLISIPSEEAQGKYDPTVNSAQPHPDKQG